MNSEPNPTPEALMLLTAQEAADYLRIPLGSLYVRIHKKEIPCTRLGRLLRFRRSELDSLMVPSAPPAPAAQSLEAALATTASAPAGAPAPAEEVELEPLKAS